MRLRDHQHRLGDHVMLLLVDLWLTDHLRLITGNYLLMMVSYGLLMYRYRYDLRLVYHNHWFVNHSMLITGTGSYLLVVHHLLLVTHLLLIHHFLLVHHLLLVQHLLLTCRLLFIRCLLLVHNLFLVCNLLMVDYLLLVDCMLIAYRNHLLVIH